MTTEDILKRLKDRDHRHTSFVNGVEKHALAMIAQVKWLRETHASDTEQRKIKQEALDPKKGGDNG